MVIGFTDEGSSFDYTQQRAQDVEKRLLPLLQAKDSPYNRFIMRVPGFGSSANSFNSFIIIALLDDWKKRDKDDRGLYFFSSGSNLICIINNKNTIFS